MAEENKAQIKPKVFIGSSSAGLEIANQIQKRLIKASSPTVWDQEDWLNKGVLEHLMAILDKYNFAVFVLRPDDVIQIKGETMKSTRDNVLLELGLFMGRYNRERVFIVCEKDEDLRIASDLLGINFALYNAESPEELAVACNDIAKQMLEIWKRDQQKGFS